jgi:hypothetical protein
MSMPPKIYVFILALIFVSGAIQFLTGIVWIWIITCVISIITVFIVHRIENNWKPVHYKMRMPSKGDFFHSGLLFVFAALKFLIGTDLDLAIMVIIIAILVPIVDCIEKK